MNLFPCCNMRQRLAVLAAAARTEGRGSGEAQTDPHCHSKCLAALGWLSQPGVHGRYAHADPAAIQST